MDDDNAPSIRPAPAPGGTVEPNSSAPAAKPAPQTQAEVAGERYEMRDPFAEVTYRANTFAGMVAKAEQTGSSRFVAVNEAGQRTTLQKLDGEWQRGPQRPAVPQQQLEGTPGRDTAASTTPAAQANKPPVPLEAADSLGATSTDAKAERAAWVASLEAALADRYLIKRPLLSAGDVSMGRTEYRFKGDTTHVAFTESTFRLATDTNSPSVARSMVDGAQARSWRALRVSGNEDFKRMVWLEASVRGVKALGYEPSAADLQLLGKEREARLVNRIEPDRSSIPTAL
jgi:hypothetical protein